MEINQFFCCFLGFFEIEKGKMVVVFGNSNDVGSMLAVAFRSLIREIKIGTSGFVFPLILTFGLSFPITVSGADAEAELIYLRANTQFNEAKYVQAIEQYNLFLAKFPGHAKRVNAQYGLGLSCFQLKKYQEAVNVLTVVAADQKCPDVPRVNYFLGQSLLQVAKYAEAEKALSDGLKALAKIPVQPREKPLRDELERSFKISRVSALVHQEKWAGVVKQSDDLKDNAGDRALEVSFYGALARFELEEFNSAVELLMALKPEVKGTTHQQHTHFLLAESYRKLGKLVEALEEYKNAATTPGSFTGEVLYRLGTINYQQGDSKKAAQLFLELLQKPDITIDPKRRESAEFYLGVLYIQLNDLKAARDLLTEIWTSKKHFFKPEAGYHLAGIITKETNSLLKAAKIFSEVSDRFPDHKLAADARLQQGIILSTLGKFEEARKSLEKFTVAYSDHKEFDKAAYQLGLCLMEQKQWQLALGYFKKVPAQSSWRDEALYQSAWCAKRKLEKPAAVKFYKELLANHPESGLVAHGTIELAEMEFEDGELVESIKRLEKLIESGLDPELKGRAHYRLGWCYFQNLDYGKAAQMYELVSNRQGINVWMTALWQAGESRLRSEEYDASSAHFKKVIQVAAPKEKNLIELQEQAWLRLANSQALAKKWNESSKTYGSFIQRYPEHSQSRYAHFGKGVALREQKIHDEAIVAFKGVLKGQKRDELGAQAQYLLAECYLDQKEYDHAIAEYIKVEMYPFDQWQSKALYEKAVAFERKGDRKRADEQFKELIKKYPETEAAKLAGKRGK